MGRPGSAPASAPVWSRRKMLALLAGAGAAGLLVIGGVVLALVLALTPDARSNHAAGLHEGNTGDPTTVRASQQEAIAAARMPVLTESDAEPGPVSTRAPGTPITLPAARGTGPADVPTGFPHTHAGAMAQLAAIDVAAIGGGSLANARAVIAAWALPGGLTTTSWSGIGMLADFLNTANVGSGGSNALSLLMTPMMGQYKGSVGADFVVPCVDFEVDATLAVTARVGVADCQRMVWHHERWMIGAGAEPAQAPSVWPDTDAALAAGYRDLTHG